MAAKRELHYTPLFGVRRLGAALACGGLDAARLDGCDKVATDQSGDKSPHSKESSAPKKTG